jgi:hypothetical protein
MDVVGWLLDADPAIRWQVLRDLTDAPADEVAAERARVQREGRGAALLARGDADGLWDGGALFPASFTADEPGQPWTTTMHTLQTEPGPRMADAVELVRRKRSWAAAGCSTASIPVGSTSPGGWRGEPSRWNTLRALRVLDWWERA